MQTRLQLNQNDEIVGSHKSLRSMKVLFACPPDRNSFIANSISSIELRSVEDGDRSADVEIGRNKFWNSEYKFDVVNLQWPESLFEGRWELNDQRVGKICQRIKEWKSRGAKVCLTRHNIKPHAQWSSADLIESIFSAIDGVVHLGQASLEEFNSRYGQLNYTHLLHKVVPHPGYFDLPNAIAPAQARESLGINMAQKVVLVFGTIRSRAEASFIKQVFEGLRIDNKLLLAPRWFRSTTRIANKLRRIGLQWDSTPKGANYRIADDFVEDDEIQNYFKSADVVLVPRCSSSNLNSGIIPLALTMGSILVGPGSGVMGEMLRDSNNGQFTDKASAINSIETVFQRSEESR